MKSPFTLSFVLVFLAFGSSVLADPDPAAGTQAYSEKVVADYLTQFTYVLKRPFYSYNWFNAGSDDSPWMQITSAKDPQGFQYFKDTSGGYWDDQGTDGGGNRYGRGLYADVDPIASRHYGGDGNTWVLMQIHMPTGFKVLDVDRDGESSVPIEVSDSLTALGCPDTLAKYGNVIQNLMAPKPGMDPKCLAALRDILENQIGLDAFFYSYDHSRFKGCGKATGSDGALVFLGNRRVTPDDIRIFNRNTRDDREDRIRIESMYYKLQFDNSSLRYYWDFRGMRFKDYPGYSVRRVNRDSTTGAITLTLYSAKDDKTVVIPAPMPKYPTTMSKDNPPQVNDEWSGSARLLWDDLDGTKTDADLGDWLKSNIFSCSPTTPYMDLPSVLELAHCPINRYDDLSDKQVNSLFQMQKQIVRQLP